jgi:hypothetical protein
MNWTILTDPLVDPAWLLLGGAIALAATVLSAWVHAPGTLYRGAALAALLAILINPTLREEDRTPINDVAVLVIDDSTSMALGSRLETRAEAIENLKRDLDLLPSLDVRIVESSDAAKDGGTALFGALDQTIADLSRDRLAGVLFVTDGQVHDVPNNLAALGIDAPVHALLVGDPNAADRKLIVEEAPRFGIVNEQVTIRIRVEEQSGNKQTVPVRVERDGELLSELRATPGEILSLDVSLPHAGENVLEITAAPGESELTEQNNKATLLITGIRDRLRVLLVSGEPHAGERTWRNLLKADPSVDLVHFTILRPPEKQDGTPISELSLIAFPTRELFSTKLDEFDLIIFDRYRRRGVLPIIYLQNVARYVENGGAVLAAAGPAFASPYSIYRTPLAGILPAQPTGQVVEEAYRAGITDEGTRHPVTAGLPGGDVTPPDWGRWFRLIEATSSSGRTIMEGPNDRPLVVLDTIGEGRVAQLLSDHAWLWTRGYDGGGPQAELLRRLAHWLMREPDLEEERLLARGENSALIVERRTMSTEAGTATITLPSGKEQNLELSETAPGRFSGQLEVEELGLYRVAEGTLRAVASIGPPNPREFEDIVATAEPLASVVKETGGGIYWLSQNNGPPSLRGVRPGRDASGRDWAGLRQNGGYELNAVSQVPFFSALFALPLLLGLLLITWRREGR